MKNQDKVSIPIHYEIKSSARLLDLKKSLCDEFL